MNLAITLLDGEKLQFKVNKDSCVIGRSSQCDVVIPHEAMSRKHCQLEIKNGEIFVTDLGSSNGVTIEGQKITPNTPVPYQTYFLLSFGAVSSITVTVDDAPSSLTSTREATQIGHSSITKTERISTKSSVTTAKKPKAKVSDDKRMKMVVLVIILAVLAYVFVLPELENSPPESTEIYE